MSRILHILSQIPSQTGSGVFFDNISSQAKACGHEQAAVIGLPASLKEYPFLCRSHTQIYPVLFETAELPFKIPGMSDVMPYDSTHFSEMTVSEIDIYKCQFKSVLSKAIEAFSPDVILSNHLWVATAVAAELLEEMKSRTEDNLLGDHPARPLNGHFFRPQLYAICHGTDLRQNRLSPNIRPYVEAQMPKLSGVFGLHRQQILEIQQLYGLPPERLFLSGSGYNAHYFHKADKPSRSSAKTELIYVGKLAYSKGVMALIQTLSLLDASQFRLTIVGKGSGPEAEAIFQAISENEQLDIFYAGYLDQATLADCFRAADIFVLPSFYEGLPLVVIEALASGLRVVVNELNGLREWLGDEINQSGLIAYVPMPELEGVDQCKKAAEEPYVKALATAIMDCSKNLVSESPSSLDPYKVIEERSWEKVFKKMETVFLSWGSKAL